MCGCKRPMEISEFLCDVRGSQCRPKSYVARGENTRSSYDIDLELSDRIRE